MVAATKETLGIGIYTPAEAAFYARVRTQTMARWLFGDSHGASVVQPQLATDDEKVVTFLDFVQALAIRAIRALHKVPLQKIREAVEIARNDYGIVYPFAVQHTTYLFSDQQEAGHGDVVLRIGEQMIQASGKQKRNLIMREVAELYLRDLHFDPNTGLADLYVAWRGSEGNKIIMDPRRQFGEPLVESCGYSANTLWEAYEIEGGVEAAARAFGVKNEDVELACSYFDHLISPSAA